MKYTFLLVVALLAAQNVASAQVRGDKCGTWENSDVRLGIIAKYFVDDDQAAFREGLIDKVSPDAPQSVVLDEQICGPLMRQVLKSIRTQTNTHDVARNGYEFSVLRYGPYYAVVLLENSAPDTSNLSWATLFIFRASDMQFLGIGLV